MHNSAVECSLLCLIFLPPAAGLIYFFFHMSLQSSLRWVISLKAGLISRLQSCLWKSNSFGQWLPRFEPGRRMCARRVRARALMCKLMPCALSAPTSRPDVNLH